VQALLERAYWRFVTGSGDGTAEVRRVAEQAIEVFEGEGDDAALARAFGHLAVVDSTACRWGAATASLERGLLHARRAGDPQAEGELLLWLTGALHYGPTPVEDGIRRLEAILGRDARDATAIADALGFSGRAVVEAAGLAGLQAMVGDFAEARLLSDRAKAILEELGQTLKLAILRQVSGWIELLADAPEAAERELAWSFERLEEMGERAYLATTAALLAEACYLQGRLPDADRFSEAARSCADEDDVVSQILWRATQGKLAARRGELDSGERLVRDAVELSRRTDDLNTRADKLADLAEVLRLAGRDEEAGAALADALGLYEAKGNIVSAGRARALLSELEP
jgi:ATP/maltotriose-dependent transcriptional regulator MalT